ncbi:hypothetical protein L6R52_04805 [Myxococcota bacterium]|nr:hypothetical protein [Myxococcota bacterium]
MLPLQVRRTYSLALSLLLSSTACMAVGDEGAPESVPGLQSSPALELPVASAYLDRKYRENGGLLSRLDEHGRPITSGADMDPMVLEARQFYDTLREPFATPKRVDYPDPFTGLDTPMRETAPLTLTAWKERFGIPARRRDERLQEYRDRVGIAIYYNQYELGLGRELGCSRFIDGYDDAGEPLWGTACYVTNYGITFRDRHNSLRAAMEGTHPKNTVCITHRPTMDEGYQVQFYVYGADGTRQDWAQLDSLGPRPAPRVCMNCHGGTYDEERHLAKWARFLPLDPNLVGFYDAEGVPAGVTRAGQEERIRKMNALALGTPLAPEQQALFRGLYGGETEEPGATSVRDYVPPGWSKTEAARDLYVEVVKPFCGTCHFADERGLDGSRKWFYEAFEDHDVFMSTPMLAWVCGDFQMPNAQPTMVGFWSPHRGPVDIAGTQYPTAADALLAAYGSSRDACTNLERVVDCRRGGDALCGDAHSGMACDAATGRCVPSFPEVAPTSPLTPTGVCKLDGSRGCGASQECRPASAGPTGFDGACHTCGLLGYAACELEDRRCRPGLVEDARGVCVHR